MFDVHAALPELPIVGVGGVATADDAVELLMAGATRCRWAPPPSPIRARAAGADELGGWCDAHGVDAVASLTGALR